MYCNQDLNTVQIAKIIGCCDATVGRILKKNDIPRIHTPNELTLTKEEIQDICNRYQNMETSTEIAKQYNISDTSVLNILKRNNVKRRAAKRRSPVKNHDYFAIIDSIDKAYFLGWMISDGSVVEQKTRIGREKVISIEIHEKDKYILELFAKVLGANKSIVQCFEKRKHVHLRFASDRMADDLSKYGVVPRKTHITYLPKLRDDLMPHLIRGIFDGDGTITIDKKNYGRVGFYGTELLCQQIGDYLCHHLNFNKNKVSKSTCYHIWYGGRGVIKRLMKWMYEDCREFYLERKYLKFKEVK